MKYCETYFDELKQAVDSLDLNSLYGRSVLITGGSGLILSALTDILCFANMNRNADITIYLAARTEEEISSRFTEYYGQPWLHFVYYDALKPLSFDFQADYIIHGASNAHPAAYAVEPVETLLANVIGLKELLDYAVKAQTSRVLYISSSEVYGRKEEARPFNENDYGFVDILNPRACYPSGKRASETLCAAYYQEYHMETVIVRPGHIYGPTATPFDSRATAQFARDVLAGQDIVMKSAGTQLRSYCYGMDCAAAILTVLLKGKPAEAYNISNKDSVVSIRQVAEEFAKAAGHKVVFEQASDAEQKSYNLMDNSSLNAEKLEALGWKAQYSIEEGVRRTIEIMRQSK
jgi:nucleoside-diphosphate-sugar epimerase